MSTSALPSKPEPALSTSSPKAGATALDAVGAARRIPFFRSVRAKLLVVLALLSLPLLIISRAQLEDYRENLDDKAATIAKVETAAAGRSLAAWLGSHAAVARKPAMLSVDDERDLYTRLQQDVAFNEGTAISVSDSDGRAIGKLFPLRAASSSTGSAQGLAAREWSDNITRITGLRRVEPYQWTVMVGIPLVENTRAGQSGLTLAAIWAVALVASCGLGVWAVGRFTQPLCQLAESASAFGAGDLQKRVRVETDDEVGSVAQNFNWMAAQLEKKFHEVQQQGAFIGEVLDGLPLGVVVLDATITVRKANLAFSRFVGREAGDLVERRLGEVAPGLEVLSDVVEDVRRTRKPFISYGLPLDPGAHDRERAHEDDASRFWDVIIWPMSDVTSASGSLILILADVSKRVRAEKLATSAFAAERTRAAELLSVINQINEGVVIINRHGSYRMNPAAHRIVGGSETDAGKGAEELIAQLRIRDLDGNALDRAEAPWVRALENRESLSGVQLKIEREDGEVRVLAISATPLTGEGGGDEGAVAVFRDITEEVHQHDELVAAYERLREHDRLKSAFVSNMSHELRTPLNVIIGLCQLLERDHQLPLAPLQSEAVSRMERNARSLLDLVNDLLDYSRLEAGRAALHLERLSVKEVVRDVVYHYRPEINSKGIDLRVDVTSELDRVLTDRQKLSQVVANLVGNAIKFTPTGAVTISASLVDNDRWCLEVSDTGIGIANEALTYIFDEFRQVDDRLARSYGGTGLGLAITRKIVELLEGEITVESTPQAGSHFRVVWPRVVRQRTGTGSLVRRTVPSSAQVDAGDRVH